MSSAAQDRTADPAQGAHFTLASLPSLTLMAAFPKAPFSPFAMCLSPRPVNGFGDPAAPGIAVHFHRDPLQPSFLVKGCLQLVNQPFTHRQMFTGELSKHPGATPERGLQRAGCFWDRSRSRLAGRSVCGPRAPLPGDTLQGEATQHPEHRGKHGHPKESRKKQTSLLPSPSGVLAEGLSSFP